LLERLENSGNGQKQESHDHHSPSRKKLFFLFIIKYILQKKILKDFNNKPIPHKRTNLGDLCF